MEDSHGRKINYLRVSLTDMCNLRCMYCMPEGKCNQNYVSSKMSIEEIDLIIRIFAECGVEKVRFTGGEPLIVKDISKIIYNASQVKGIKDISLTTNGIFLKDKIDELKKAGLNRVNVSMDTLKEDKYERITGRSYLKKVKEGIEVCLDKGITPVKINVVLMKGINLDEVDEFIKIAEKMPIDVRFIELMPIGAGTELFKNHFIPYKDIVESHPNLIPEDHRVSSTAELYKSSKGKGRIGFISPISCNFCSECNRVRLTAEGGIKSCLHGEEEINVISDVRDLLKKYNLSYCDLRESREYSILKKKILGAMYNKPLGHRLSMEGKSRSNKQMFQIGG